MTVRIARGLFGASLYCMRFVPQQFFPSSDRPELLVDLQLPENSSIYATQEAAARLDKLLKSDADVDHWSTYVGQGAVRFYLPPTFRSGTGSSDLSRTRSRKSIFRRRHSAAPDLKRGHGISGRIDYAWLAAVENWRELVGQKSLLRLTRSAKSSGR